jgi:hypothetical protein
MLDRGDRCLKTTGEDMMKRNQNPVAHWFGSALLAANVLFGSAAVAQERPVAEAAPAGQIKDERALDLLKGMSDTLAKAQTLGFQVRSLVPFATPFGQQISLFGTSRVAMRRARPAVRRDPWRTFSAQPLRQRQDGHGDRGR